MAETKNDTLLQKLVKAIIDVENPKLDSEAEVKTKGGYSYKYKYASLGECLRVVRDVCNPLGLAVWFDINNGNIYTIVSDGMEEKAVSPVPAKLDGLPQSNGSEITYAKRYSLSAAFGLVSEEDDDAQSAQNTPRKAASKKGGANVQSAPIDHLKEAQNKLKKVLMEYCGNDKEAAKRMFDDLSSSSGYMNTPELYEMKANELLTELRARG